MHAYIHTSRCRLAVIFAIATAYQVEKKYELLNCDKHKALAKRLKKDIAQCRPDIVHQVQLR